MPTNFAPPVNVSPLIRFGRYAMLFTGIAYGAFWQSRYTKKELALKDIKAKEKAARDAKIAHEKQISAAGDDLILIPDSINEGSYSGPTSDNSSQQSHTPEWDNDFNLNNNATGAEDSIIDISNSPKTEVEGDSILLTQDYEKTNVKDELVKTDTIPNDNEVTDKETGSTDSLTTVYNTDENGVGESSVTDIETEHISTTNVLDKRISPIESILTEIQNMLFPHSSDNKLAHLIEKTEMSLDDLQLQNLEVQTSFKIDEGDQKEHNVYRPLSSVLSFAKTHFYIAETQFTSNLDSVVLGFINLFERNYDKGTSSSDESPNAEFEDFLFSFGPT